MNVHCDEDKRHKMRANVLTLTVLYVTILRQVTFATDLASGALTVKNGAIDCTGPPSVTFDLHVCDIGGVGGAIAEVNFYYVDGDNFEEVGATKSAAHDATLSTTVAAGGDHTFTDESISLVDDGSCGDYTHLCAVITVTGDTDTTNDDSCIILAVDAPSTDNCPDTQTTVPPAQTSGGTPCSTCTDDPPGSTASTNTTESVTESSAHAFSVGRYLMVPSLIAAMVAVL